MLTLMESFQKKIKNVPLLTADEEIELGRALIRARDTGDEHERIRLRNKFMSHNIRLVIKVLGRYRTSSVPADDLFSEGLIGLMKAVDKFDPERGFRFNTYAWPWVHQAMSGFIRAKGNNVHVPSNVLENYSRIRKARASLGDSASIDELAKATKLSADEVLHAILSVNKEVSLVQPIMEDMLLEDVIAAPEGVNASDRITDSENVKRVLTHLADLSPRAREVIVLRFGLTGDEPMTLQEIGDRFGVSRERIRQIEHEAMRVMSQHAKVRMLCKDPAARRTMSPCQNGQSESSKS